jgi:hypothetical protein
MKIGPLLLKPYRGRKGHAQLIWDPDELDHIADGGLFGAPAQKGAA